ncbi:MAG: hypothetical protein IEMM0002_1589 [bacterium]|nr:MAG: hypothetical protein IEMM0002_1589 [bacterium]
MQPSSHVNELAERVERFARELVYTRKENVRLKRLLAAAEIKIKKIVNPEGRGANGGILELTRRVERMKEERKMIKTKIEKMAIKLEQFYS